MTDTNQAAWTGYWLGAGRGSGCLPGAPAPLNAALAATWAAFADALPPAAQVLDIATGSGAVVVALTALRGDIVAIGVDNAGLPASGLDLRGDIDAAALPFADASFDAVSSQFGIEYCAPAALTEAARVLRPGGALGFVVHCCGSRAVAHNRARRAALVGLRDAGIFAMARRAMLTDKIDERQRANVEAARRTHAAQTIVDELPRAIELAFSAAKPLFELDELARKADQEIARLRAMLDAALDTNGIALLCAALVARNVAAQATPLFSDGANPDAWVVRGTRTTDNPA